MKEREAEKDERKDPRRDLSESGFDDVAKLDYRTRKGSRALNRRTVDDQNRGRCRNGVRTSKERVRRNRRRRANRLAESRKRIENESNAIYATPPSLTILE